ncbi:MAG: DNA repair protein RadC [Clostridia bacterium]|nr:DNA repair protein RadC [Clostridia bacterium]
MGSKQYNLTIREMPKGERPRERLLKYGVKALSDGELLAILLRTGTKNQSAITLAHKLLAKEGGLRYLIDATVEELSTNPGIGLAKASQIKASIELGRRISSMGTEERYSITTPRDAANLLMGEMRHLKKEHFKVIELNIKNQVMGIESVSIGNINTSIAHPREVFSNPIKVGCASIILAHNHPSGDPKPSSADIKVTKRIVEAGKILGIEVLDHIIIGDGIFISLKQKELM